MSSLKRGELLVKVNYEKLGQAIKLIRAGINRLEAELNLAGAESDIKHMEDEAIRFEL